MAKGILFLIVCLSSLRLCAQEIKLLTATNHPMQYYVSLPTDWSASKTWPVLMVLEDADKQYKENLERFIKARGDMPFILVAPIHVNNGNQGRRDPKLFPYAAATWDYIEKVGDCQFNDEGLRQVMLDVQNLYHSEDKYFVTGFEAAAHTLLSLVLNHPEYLRAAIPVAANYRGRCVDESIVSKDPSRVTLPIHAITAENDEYFGPKGNLYSQWTQARDLAKKNGYTNITEEVVKGKGHEELPEEVMGWLKQFVAH